MSSISQENLIRLFNGQCRTADIWVEQWKRYKDAASVRNAALAIGKIFGIYNVLVFMIAGDENLPEEIINQMKPYQEVWNQLGV